MPNYITEDEIEKAICKVFQDELGYELLNAYTVREDNPNDKTNRTDKAEVVFHEILKKQLIKINPKIPPPVIDSAIAKLTDKRNQKSPLMANKEVYHLLKDGILVEYEDQNGKKEHGYVRVLDYEHPDNNHFLVVRQMWIKGSLYYRRPVSWSK